MITVFAAGLAVWASVHSYEGDHMLAFDAALRLVQGQVLYRDFFYPEGPLTPWLLSPFLALAPSYPIGWWTAAGCLNALATLGLAFVLKSATGSPFYALMGATLTAVWYLPPFGTFYHDHLAFLFILLAIAALVGRRLLIASSLLALSYHAKQSFGLAAAVVGLSVVWQHREQARKAILAYAVTHLAVLASVALTGEFEQYLSYSFLTPIDFAAKEKGGNHVWLHALFPWGIDPLRAIREVGLCRLSFFPVMAFLVAVPWVLWRRGLFAHRTLGLLALATYLCTIVSGRFFGHQFWGMGGVIPLVLQAQRAPRWLCHLCLCVFTAMGALQIGWLHGVSAQRHVGEAKAVAHRLASLPGEYALMG